MFKTLIALLIISLSGNVYAEIHFLRTGEFSTNEVPKLKKGDKWFSISAKGDVKEVKISIRKDVVVEGYVSDDLRGINYTDSENDSFIISGLDLKPGKIKTYEPSKALYPGQEHSFSTWNPEGHIRFIATGAISPLPQFKSTSLKLDRYELSISNGESLATFINETNVVFFPYNFLWVGDLNGDNVPDFIISKQIHDSGATKQTLYLSDKTGPLKMKAVATLTILGC